MGEDDYVNAVAVTLQDLVEFVAFGTPKLDIIIVRR